MVSDAEVQKSAWIAHPPHHIGEVPTSNQNGGNSDGTVSLCSLVL